MKNTELLNSLSIEELQDRNEFSSASDDKCVIIGCCGQHIDVSLEQQN